MGFQNPYIHYCFVELHRGSNLYLVIEDHIGVSIYSLNSDTEAISTIGLASCAGRLRIALR